jgi:hypothetical protein
MAIKPIDMQVMVPRTMEAAKISNDINQKNTMAQQQQATATQHRAEDSLRQVYSRTQAQNARINERQKENGKKEGKGKKSGGRDGNDEERKSLLEKEIKSSTIDIKI